MPRNRPGSRCTLCRQGGTAVRARDMPATSDTWVGFLAVVWILPEPGGLGLQALCDRGVVGADQFTDHDLESFSLLDLLIAAGLLRLVQARDGNQVTAPDHHRARVNRVEQAQGNFDRNIPEEELELRTKRHRLTNRRVGQCFACTPTHKTSANPGPGPRQGGIPSGGDWVVIQFESCHHASSHTGQAGDTEDQIRHWRHGPVGRPIGNCPLPAVDGGG